MLHIFLSGFRSAYQVAALNAVCAPIGSVQKFTYSEGRNVSAATTSALATAKAEDPVLLTFADRFATGGYRYIPIRRGRFVSVLIDSGKVEVTVRFEKWLKSAAADDYNVWVAHTLVPLGAPRLVDSPENSADGEYVLFADDPPEALFVNEDGWRSLVEQLSNTRALGTSGTQTTVFARLDVIDGKANVAITDHSGGALRLKRATTYRARVDYLFPLQATNRNAEVPYNLVFSPGLEAERSGVGGVGAYARADEFQFRVSPLSQRTRETIQLHFGPAPTDVKGLISPRLELPVEPVLSSRVSLWLVGIGAIWVIGTGLSTQAASNAGDFRWGYYLAPLIQYSAFVAMFRAFGMKLV